jgi:TetR/AcrR family transcriptional regulator, transcriptional repressor for nem operon
MDLKETIIRESLKLFSLNGFIGTSMHDIITAAGTSKGGFYNHFASKEDLFRKALVQARKMWRERNLYGLDNAKDPIEKIKRLLGNYRDRYLIDSSNFPGGCIFIIFSVELGDQRPHLAKEVQKGFIGLKAMLNRLLDEARKAGLLQNSVSTAAVTEILFNGMLGASINYSAAKSAENLHQAIDALIDYLENSKA